MKNTLRWCADIGMWSLDRPINDIPHTNITGSCVHRTSFCDATCYNIKLYRMFPAMLTKDIRNEQFWQSLPTQYKGAKDNPSIQSLREKFKNSRRQTSRVRLMTRGEGIKDGGDVSRIQVLCFVFKDVNWWLPTRAWRNRLLRTMCETTLLRLPNLSLNASLDPTTTKQETANLEKRGWSTMYFGDDTQIHTPTGKRRFKCPKTWANLKGHCGICKGGCMSTIALGRRSDVHLSQH
jgi:hypothetical protein